AEFPGIAATAVTRPARCGPIRRHFIAEKVSGLYCAKAVAAATAMMASEATRAKSFMMPPKNGRQFTSKARKIGVEPIQNKNCPRYTSREQFLKSNSSADEDYLMSAQPLPLLASQCSVTSSISIRFRSYHSKELPTLSVTFRSQCTCLSRSSNVILTLSPLGSVSTPRTSSSQSSVE